MKKCTVCHEEKLVLTSVGIVKNVCTECAEIINRYRDLYDEAFRELVKRKFVLLKE